MWCLCDMGGCEGERESGGVCVCGVCVTCVGVTVRVCLVFVCV